jgi:hypothetical protein
VIVSTGLKGIAAVLQRTKALDHDTAYQTALASSPGRVTSLLFVDFSQLLSLADQTRLTNASAFGAVRRDLQRIRAVGLESTRGEADSTAELFLQIP